MRLGRHDLYVVQLKYERYKRELTHSADLRNKGWPLQLWKHGKNREIQHVGVSSG
jgi:hypothetical protein